MNIFQHVTKCSAEDIDSSQRCFLFQNVFLHWLFVTVFKMFHIDFIISNTKNHRRVIFTTFCTNFWNRVVVVQTLMIMIHNLSFTVDISQFTSFFIEPSPLNFVFPENQLEQT